MWRHFHDAWLLLDGFEPVHDPKTTLDEALCGLFFNVHGLLHEVMIDRNVVEDEEEIAPPVVDSKHE